jgi:hypothetical protein
MAMDIIAAEKATELPNSAGRGVTQHAHEPEWYSVKDARVMAISLITRSLFGVSVS